MNSSKKLAAIFALAISAGLAGTGCMAQPDATDDATEGQDELAGAPADQATDAKSEKTGEAAQKCGFGGWGGGWGGWGGGWGGWGGYPGWGGWGWGYPGWGWGGWW